MQETCACPGRATEGPFPADGVRIRPHGKRERCQAGRIGECRRRRRIFLADSMPGYRNRGARAWWCKWFRCRASYAGLKAICGAMTRERHRSTAWLRATRSACAPLEEFRKKWFGYRAMRTSRLVAVLCALALGACKQPSTDQKQQP